jgi:hypothetical protein
MTIGRHSQFAWQARTPMPANDPWVVVSAMEHGLRVLTTDDHYHKIPQIMVNYFAAG